MDDFVFKDELEDEDYDNDLDEELENPSVSYESEEKDNKEEIEEEPNFGNDLNDSKKINRANKKFSLIVTIAVSLLFGLLVFFIVYFLFNPKEETNGKDNNLDIESTQVLQLYSMVTYGMTGTRYEKYIKEPKVTLEDFSNYDKFYYALSYVENNDFHDTGSNTENQLEQYTLGIDKISSYMRKYFGDDVTFDKKVSIVYTFLEINKMNRNTGTLMYDEMTKKYNIVFSSREYKSVQSLASKKYFTKLSKATQISDNEIELVEDIIYTKCTRNQSSTYSCNLYKDYENTVKIADKPGVSNETELNFDEYENHSKIIYRFKKSSEGTYVFSSSKIVFSE